MSVEGLQTRAGAFFSKEHASTPALTDPSISVKLILIAGTINKARKKVARKEYQPLFLPNSSRGRQYLSRSLSSSFSLSRTSIDRVVVDKADQRRQGLLEARDGRAPRTLPGVVGQVVHRAGAGLAGVLLAACLPAGIKVRVMEWMSEAGSTRDAQQRRVTGQVSRWVLGPRARPRRGGLGQAVAASWEAGLRVACSSCVRAGKAFCAATTRRLAPRN